MTAVDFPVPATTPRATRTGSMPATVAGAVARWARANTLIITAAVAVVVLLAASITVAGAQRRADRLDTHLHATARSLAASQATSKSLAGDVDHWRATAAASDQDAKDARATVAAQGGQLDTFKGCFTALQAIGDAVDRGDEAGIQSAARDAHRACAKVDAIL